MKCKVIICEEKKKDAGKHKLSVSGYKKENKPGAFGQMRGHTR